MSQTISIWVLVAAALLAANLPFVSQKILGLWTLPAGKTFALRFLELLACYFLTGALALFLEQRAGQIAPQGWEFYAITATLFITLAFPGFVYRYLLRHRD